MTRPARSFALSILALAAAGCVASAHAVTYQLVDLGALVPGGASAAYGLNNRGQVVGGSVVAGREQAFSWTAAGGMVGVHGAVYPLSGSVATGVNDAGQIAVAYGNPLVRIFEPGGAFATVAVPAGTVYADATGINAAGRVSGTVATGTLVTAFTGTGGAAALLLPTTDTESTATAINTGGAVAGSARTGIGAYHAVLWSQGGTPQSLGSLGGSSFAQALNDRGQVAGSAEVATAAGTVQRAFVWSAGSGMVAIGSLHHGSVALGINDAGQAVGFGFDTSYSAPSGAFLWTERAGLLDINTLIARDAGQRVLKATAINAWGQVVGAGSSGRAVLLTPTGDLAWQGSAGGSFNEGRNWELGFVPSSFVDAQVYTTGAQVITLDRDATVNSLGLGSAAGGRPMLALRNGATLNATYGVTVRSTGTLTGDGRVAGAVVNQGTVLASNLHMDCTLINQGRVITVAGEPGRLATDLDNQAAGQVRVGSAERLVISGASHHNSGVIEVRGGELEVSGALANAVGGRVLINGGSLRLNDGLANGGEVSVGFDGAEIFGLVAQGAGGRLVLSGRSNSTFYDAVDIGTGSELRVSAGATALFFGTVQQRSGAQFTGTGTKFYEGGLSVGASPGLGRDEGSVVFGSSNLYLAEIGGTAAGSAFDKLVVAGDLHFGGRLKLVSWAGFAAQAGQRFDLFDWGSAGGSFSSIDASGLELADGLVLDTSRLYVDGSIAVTSVPEPAGWALALAGLLVVARVTRRRC
ncbi:MAG: hypothetical protein JNL93_22995 [Pelomonas sp.]|nr:hypothetical protein [Roseateles sp.]